MATKKIVVNAGGIEVPVSNPDKLYFAKAGLTKLDVVRYYLAVADAALRGVARRPMMLKRYVDGADAEPFYQKRAPANRPPYVEIATFHYASGRHADEVVCNNVASLIYVVNLGCIELHPHAVRADDMDRPDELRIDLDPVPGVSWPQILEVARRARDVLAEVGLVGWPKTSGSRGAHLWVRIEPRWTFAEVKRAAQALAREVEARAPELATAKWAKEHRHGVFLDYNQNARDRTTCSAYSLRARDDARVSMPLSWDDFVACDPAAYTLRTVPALLAERGDAHAAIDAHPGRLDALLALADRQDAAGAGEARAPRLPVITIAQAKRKPDALAGLERWKARHPEVAAHLLPEDVIVDANRGRATAWYRVRVNLQHVPAELHPPAEAMDPAYDPRSEWTG
ncbi:MAG TPA: non-homologous end-joining DNA ligase [Kofleriaceae bacterium]|nr:non-homologous end-joining DNA ligase [Kofleriaceae bacterium]